MQLVLTPDQVALRDTVRSYLAKRAGSAHLRTMIDSDAGFDRGLWESLERDLGLLSLAVPEELGGAGAGQVERVVVCEELGRALLPTPYLASAVLASDVLATLEGDAVSALLKRMSTGEVIACVATEGDTPDEILRAVRDGERWRLDGVRRPVIWASAADVALVAGQVDGGLGWFLVEGSAQGLTRTALRSLDPTRRLSRLEFRAAEAQLLGWSSAPAIERARDLGRIALAGEQLGGLRKVVEDTVEYVKVRFQFGREIGSYQGVKHQLADLHVGLEEAESVVRYAAWAADHQPEELPLATGLVGAFVGKTYFAAASDAVRLHGGIGYTWEHDLHFYYKHAKSTELLLGTAVEARRRIAHHLGLDAESAASASTDE